jgi:hypothetical protein
VPGEETSILEASPADPDVAWRDSLREVMRAVVSQLPDTATLGELVDATRRNPHLARVLEIFSVHELIELARQRPAAPKDGGKNRGEISFDEDGNPVLDLGEDNGPSVIRRRADVPDGDVRVLRALQRSGPQREVELATQSSLTTDQVRIILRSLRTRGLIHVEGSGAKRRVKITRQGHGYMRKLPREEGSP